MLIFWGICFWARAVSLHDDRRNPWVWHVPVALMLINMYLVQATTLCLTDILASCLIVLGIMAMIYLPITPIAIAIEVGIVSMAGMMRPASLFFLLSMPVLYSVRYLTETQKFSIRGFLRPFPNAIIAFCIVVFPQLMINQTINPGAVKFPIVKNLWSGQQGWGNRLLKYGTSVDGQMVGHPVKYSIPDSLRKIPGGVRVGKVLAMADQGEVNTYMREFDSIPRKVASVFYYGFLYMTIVGIVSMIYLRRWKEFVLIMLPLLLYMAALSSCAVESRFFYPCIMLSMPLCACGIEVVTRKSIRNSWKWGLAGMGVAWEFMAFSFSYWLDGLIM